MRGCLEDLEAQTIADAMEIVVIDAASPQQEGKIVREFQQRFDNIHYVRTAEREPLYASWNRAIALARGKYLTSANTDDRHRTDALEILVRTLEERPDAAIAYADVAITTRENETFDQAERFVFYRWPEFDRRLLFKVPYLGPQPVWRRDLHHLYGFFDPELASAGDYEFWLRLCHTESFIHVPEVLGLYLAAPGSVEHRNAARNWRESEEARTRHWPREWGRRPRAHGVLLRFDSLYTLRRLLAGDLQPAREILGHAMMLVAGRLERHSNQS